MPLFVGILVSFIVLHRLEGLTTSKKYSSSISMNKLIGYPSNYSSFLKAWKTLYTAQKEIVLFIAEYADRGTLRCPNRLKYLGCYNYLIDNSLYQMKLLEDLRSMTQDETTRDSLTNYVEKMIYRNQNPKHCRDIEVIGYETKEYCGLGCQIHLLGYCLIVALGEGKPLVVKSDEWQGFDSIFDVLMPLSETCHYNMTKSHNLKVEFINLSYHYKNMEYLPKVIPENIRQQIEEFHTDPFLWWIAQIITYVLRLRPNVIENLEPKEFTSPIVGVHVRRTDKLVKEAKSYPVEEYMKYVELYFRKLGITSKGPKKSVYLATDDSHVISQFRWRYPDYTFITSNVRYLRNRHDQKGTYSILSDIYNLANTDYLVCTFSSNVCRLAFQLMNGKRMDASENYHSLDHVFLYAYQQTPSFSLRLNHTIGDLMLDKTSTVYLSDRQNGRYLTVKLKKSSEDIKVPAYKLKENLLTTNFKAFENINT
ncbi:Alpha-(1,6)-fucosyltransferase [Thelohanellus kitauei]|uniref:Alpha-(1,6)-fucosyltransferase n=1 Tax=Thelohanellus kitauei TaxID=669202 RepID=A0A0C2M9T3_THEKT|nr:Alpha-(1,6)-fucosyltransferase [Thelohanellus kitauei]